MKERGYNYILPLIWLCLVKTYYFSCYYYQTGNECVRQMIELSHADKYASDDVKA